MKQTIAIACCFVGWAVVGGWIGAREATAWPNYGAMSSMQSHSNLEAIADEILPYPDFESVPIYPDSPSQLASDDEADSNASLQPQPTLEQATEPVLLYPDADSLPVYPVIDTGPDVAVPLYPESTATSDSVNAAQHDEPILIYPDGPSPETFPETLPPAEPADPGWPSATSTNSSSPVDASTAVLIQSSEEQVLDVQVVGGEADVQQLAKQVIRLQPGAIATSAALDADVAALESTGYFTSVSVSTQPQPNGVVVIYRVEPVVVRSLQLLGAAALPPEIFNRAVAPQQNQPISPQLLAQATNQINGWYFENGYALAGVQEWIVEPDGLVILEVVEPVVGAIAIQFVEDGSPTNDSGEPIEGRTREDFIRRELSTQEGAVFNQNDVVSDLEILSRLGVFQDATVAIEVDDEPQPPVVDVIYQVEEGFARNVRVGGGISTELGLFGSINYSDRNFRGLGEEINLGIQAGGRGLQFNTGFTRPYRASQPNQLGYSINAARSNFQSLTFSDEVGLNNGDDAREQRFGGGVSVMRPLGQWEAELGLDYQRVSIRDDDGDVTNRDEFGNQLTVSDSGLDDLLLLGFNITQDRRINPFNPAGGSILRLSTEQSVPVGNGSIFMNRLRANYARYLPVDVLGSGSIQNPEVVALNVQGGTVLGELPPYEAFDLGGSGSVRGYRGGEVGSGRSYILASAEYRFPIFSVVGGVLFADIASDLGSGSSVEGDPAGIRDKPGTGLGYGFGVRVGSPLGLIRADFGLNDQGDSRFHFGFGQRF